jgi:hypothetical protein
MTGARRRGDGSDIGLKLASSAAALYGRPLVSSESFVWMNRPYSWWPPG